MVRLKHRWLLITLSHPTSSLSCSMLTKFFRSQLELHFGDSCSTSTSQLLCKYYSSFTGTILLRCSRESFHLIRASICLINTLPTSSQQQGKEKEKVRFCVHHCSGTIQKIQQKALVFNQILCRNLQLDHKKFQDCQDSIRLVSA